MIHSSVYNRDLIILHRRSEMEYPFSFLLCFSLHPFPSTVLSPLSLFATHLLIISPPLWSSPHFPPLIFLFYLHWPHFLLIFCSPSPLLVIPHPFVWSDLYLLPPSVNPFFLLILPFIPSSSSDPHLFLLLLRSPILCIPTSIYTSLYPSTDIYMPLIIPFDTLPSSPQIQSLFSLSLPALPYSLLLSLFLSTSLPNSTYLPSLLPFDTLSPCPLIQSSLFYPSSPPISPSFPLNLSPSVCLLVSLSYLI